MHRVTSAELAELLDLKLVRLGLLVALRCVVSVLALRTAQKDNLSHVTFTL